MFQHPVHDRMTPDPQDQSLPPDFTTRRVQLSRGLPTPLVLDGFGFSALLSVPTGRVRHWMTMDAAREVASHIPQRLPHPPEGLNADPREQASPVLMLVEGKTPSAVMPLVINARTLLPRTGEKGGPAVELVILGFSIFAEAMRGPLAGSSWIELGWRRFEKGTDAFIAPIARRSIRQNLSATFGTGQNKRKRQINADLQSDGAPDRLAGAPRGGLNWRLAHD